MCLLSGQRARPAGFPIRERTISFAVELPDQLSVVTAKGNSQNPGCGGITREILRREYSRTSVWCSDISLVRFGFLLPFPPVMVLLIASRSLPDCVPLFSAFIYFLSRLSSFVRIIFLLLSNISPCNMGSNIASSNLHAQQPLGWVHSS